METGTYRFHEPNPQWSTQKGGMFAERAFLKEKISHKRSEWMCSKAYDQASQSWEGKFMKRTRVLVIFLSCMLALGMSYSMGHAALTASITDVSVEPNPVCNSNYPGDGFVDLSATVNGGGFDSNSEVLNYGNWGNYSGTACSGANRQRTVDNTVTTYDNKRLIIDGNGSYTPIPYEYTTSYPVGSPDDAYTETVTADSAEDKTVSVYRRTDYGYKGTGPDITLLCVGTFSLFSGPSTTTVKSTKSNGNPYASADATYRVDIEGPFIKNTTGVTNIQQGQSMDIGVNIEEGSSEATYKVTFTATNDGTTLGPFTRTGEFPGNKSDSGVQGNEHVGPVALETSCSTPIGTYTLTAKVDSSDLCDLDDDPFEYTTSDTSTFEVTAGMNLESKTQVVSEFPNGEYDFNQCFSSNKPKNKINNLPGHVHITTEVTSAGECAGLMNLTGVKLTLNAPDGFVFVRQGNSPAAHVFVFDAEGTGYDFHYPPNEVTSQVGQDYTLKVVTIDLSNLGQIPSGYTIFARAKAEFTGYPTNGTPSPANQLFTFSSSATADGGLSADSVWEVIGNPTQGCVDGRFPTP
jgi:hypothetical protein